MSKSSAAPAFITSPLVPAVLFILSGGVALWSEALPEVPRLMPQLVALVTAALCVLDFISRGSNPLSRKVSILLGADFSNREMKHDPALDAEIIMFLWMAGCVGLMMFIGLLPSVFLFVLTYMRYQGRQSWRSAILASAAALLFVTIVFEILLQYNLYRGALFDPRGFDAW